MLVAIAKTRRNSTKMKRAGNLFEQICSVENLQQAYKNAKKHKKNSYGARLFDKDIEMNLLKLHKELSDQTYRTGKYFVFIKRTPKVREIHRLDFLHRVVHHAVMNVLEPIWVNLFTSNTYSCIKGKGIHACLNDLKRDLKDFENTRFCLKLDIKKFYPSIDHDVLKEIIRKKIKCKKTLQLLDEIIDSAPGVPIGNYLSQYFANLYLAYFDHWIKEIKGVKYYYRYCDDIVILGSNKAQLHSLLYDVRNYLNNNLKLEIKKNYQIFPVDARGIDFVGYVFRHTHILLRKSIKKAMIKKLHNPKSRASYYGWCKHCNSVNLLIKLNINENTFKRTA